MSINDDQPFTTHLNKSVCVLMSQMSGSRSINVRAQYPVKVKTVVGH